MANYDAFETKTNDWRITSYGDVGVSFGGGGKITHFKFYSPSLNQNFNTVHIAFAPGFSLKIGLDFLGKIDGILKSCQKTVDGLQANSNFKPLKCYRAFSCADIIMAWGGGIETEIASICGIKSGGLHAAKGGKPLFSIPYEVSPSFGLGGGATATVGLFFRLGLGNEYWRQQFDIEMQVRKSPTDPFPRQPGGFAI